jgi:hypothetical protein
MSLRDITPDTYPHLIITHLDDSTTDIQLNPDDAYTWDYNQHHLRVKRHGGRTCFPWATVKYYTVVYPTATLETELAQMKAELTNDCD